MTLCPGFPNEAAAHVALETVRQWLETDNNAEKVDRVIFCVFLEKDLNIYWRLLHQYFPLPGETSGSTEGWRLDRLLCPLNFLHKTF